jgi:hypothetical protein
MKNKVLALAAGILVAMTGAVSSFAEEASFTISQTDAVWLTRSAIQTQRQAIVAAAMEFTDKESAAFWPVYREYWNELNPLRDRHTKIIMDFSDNFWTLSDEQAEKLLRDYLELRGEEASLKLKYVEKFKAALPIKAVLRYYQVENKLDTILQYEIGKMIPLAILENDLKSNES